MARSSRFCGALRPGSKGSHAVAEHGTNSEQTPSPQTGELEGRAEDGEGDSGKEEIREGIPNSVDNVPPGLWLIPPKSLCGSAPSCLQRRPNPEMGFDLQWRRV